jgi:hypothetical protein
MRGKVINPEAYLAKMSFRNGVKTFQTHKTENSLPAVNGRLFLKVIKQTENDTAWTPEFKQRNEGLKMNHT